MSSFVGPLSRIKGTASIDLSSMILLNINSSTSSSYNGDNYWYDLSRNLNIATGFGITSSRTSLNTTTIVFSPTQSAYYDFGTYSNIFNFNRSAFTISFWIYPYSWSIGENSAIVDKKTDDTTLGFTIFNDSTYPNKINGRIGYNNDFTSNSDVEINKWQNWTIVRENNGILKWYLNGKLDATSIYRDTYSISDSINMVVGKSQNLGGYFNGVMGELYILKYPLSANQLYNYVTTNNINNYSVGGSFAFGNTDEYLRIRADRIFSLGVGDYTIEWWQYQSATGSGTPTIFTFNTYPNQPIAATVEDGIFKFWVNDTTPRFILDISGDYNRWHYYSISRINNDLYMHLDGNPIGLYNSSVDNIDVDTYDLIIGNDGVNRTTTCFPGYITGFKYTTGRSVYTSHPYIPPISERKASSDTVLLLNAINSTVYLNDSSLNRFSVMGNQTKWDFKSPYLVTA